jgi:hypothetical protein
MMLLGLFKIHSAKHYHNELRPGNIYLCTPQESNDPKFKIIKLGFPSTNQNHLYAQQCQQNDVMQIVNIIESLMNLDYFDQESAYYSINKKLNTIRKSQYHNVFIAMLEFKDVGIKLANTALKNGCNEISAEIRESFSLLDKEINKNLIYNNNLDVFVLTKNL